MYFVCGITKTRGNPPSCQRPGALPGLWPEGSGQARRLQSEECLGPPVPLPPHCHPTATWYREDPLPLQTHCGQPSPRAHKWPLPVHLSAPSCSQGPLLWRPCKTLQLSLSSTQPWVSSSPLCPDGLRRPSWGLLLWKTSESRLWACLSARSGVGLEPCGRLRC